MKIADMGITAAAAATSITKLELKIRYQNLHIFIYCLFLITLGFQYLPQLSHSHSTVQFIPGFRGQLPFHLQTGYVGVDKSEEVELFYYFVKSERNPKEDPLILWITGGPGCSSFTALAYEFGPLHFKQLKYDGTLPTLTLNPNSWTKIANIIFLDLPVGTGFSYGKTSVADHSTDPQASVHALQFLSKWFISHPEFLENPFYVGGDSYSGIIVPVITQMISDRNEAGLDQLINLKGYLLGNPKTSPDDENFKYTFAHGMGLISDELYESLKRNCKLDSAECSRDLKVFSQCISNIDEAHILEKNCERDYLELPGALSDERRAAPDRFGEQNNLNLPHSVCRVDGYWLSYYWLNDANVQKALHVKKGTIKTWARCSNSLDYDTVILDSRPYHANLSRKSYRSLIYSGDHDMVIPFQSTQAWIRDLNYSIVDDWRPWSVNGQYAGYTRTYSNNMTFATVKGGGHTAPEYRPEECYAMFERWLSQEPL